jgi:hypothetical protein
MEVTMHTSQGVFTSVAGISMTGVCLLAIGFLLWVLYFLVYELKSKHSAAKHPAVRYRFALKPHTGGKFAKASEAQALEPVLERRSNLVHARMLHRHFVIGA